MRTGQPPTATLRWGWRDIVASARWGFSDRKIALHARGVAVSYALALAYFYLLPASHGAKPLATRFATHRFDLAGLFASTMGPALAGGNTRGGPAAHVYLAPVLVGLVWAVNAYYAIAVARMTSLQVRGDFFVETRNGIACARRRIGGVLAVMLMLAAAPMLVTVALFAGGLITRIPVVGGVWLAIGPALLLPAFFASLLMGLVGLILLAGAASLPAIAGVSDDRAVETSYQLTVIVWREGWRLIAYHALAAVVAAGAGCAFLVVGARSFFWLVDAVCAGGPEYARIVSAAGHAVWGASRAVAWVTGWQFAPSTDLGVAGQISVWLTGGAFFAVTVVFVSYVLSVGSVGSAMAYMNLLRRIWGVNVLVASNDETPTDADTAPSPAGPAPTTTGEG